MARVFPPIWNARYEADRAAARSLEPRKLGIFGPIVYSAVALVIHVFVNPEPNVWAFSARFLLFPPHDFFRGAALRSA